MLTRERNETWNKDDVNRRKYKCSIFFFDTAPFFPLKCLFPKLLWNVPPYWPLSHNSECPTLSLVKTSLKINNIIIPMLLQLAGSHIPHPHLCLIQNRLQNHCTHNSVAETHPQHQNIVTLPHLQMQLKGSKVPPKIKNWPHLSKS